ncbi:MAG: glycoside hydrolase family 1 protein [bacterium]
MTEPFIWGAATSAHQVEGNNTHNDWWEWEQNTPGVTSSGRAADHYSRFKEDFALAKSLGHNAYRLSLEWSRIENEKGKWNEQALKHYRQVLEELKKQNMISFVTLHHFTNPLWLAKSGGWVSREAIEEFTRYVEIIINRLGDLIDFWVTINEPVVYASQAYWHGCWPPQKKNVWSMWRVLKNMAAAHRRAYRIIHRASPLARVGLAKHVIGYSPEQRLKNYWFNHYFFSLTRGRHDYIGVNYYFVDQNKPWQGPKSDLDWPICAEGLTRALVDMKRYNLPIYVTENGLADADDSRRADFIRDHLRAIEEAQRQGADVKGYLHWALLDNFEWEKGFAPRFGLVEVDYKTMERKVRPSAYVYKAIIESAGGGFK